MKIDIETKIKKLNLSSAVGDELQQNYQVREVQAPHERVMGQDNLEVALKD